MSELYWNNFRQGQRRDAALRDDALLSARQLDNFDILYDGESADLQIRPGFTRWNAVELSAPAQQLYPFVDLDQNFNLLGITDSRWKAIESTGSPITLVDEDATATRPVTSFGNRSFFGTDTAAYWTDDASIDGVDPSYRLGIVKPGGPPPLTLVNSEGRTTYNINWLTPPGPTLELNNTTHVKIGSQYTPSSDITVSTVWIPAAYLAGVAVTDGQVRLAIMVESANLPDAAVSGDAVSDWVTITALDENVEMYIEFNLYAPVDLSNGVNYWIILESDDDYQTNYTAASPFFYIGFGWANDPTFAARYTGGAWVGSTYAFPFLINGLDPTHWYDYKYTYVNETYNSESRPSEKSIRITPTVTQNQIFNSFISSVDPQIDVVNVYRRDIGTDAAIQEGNITDNFMLAGTGTIAGGYTDSTSPDQIGARLHSEDHYLYDEADDTNQGKRGAFIPAGFVVWKGRIWAWEANANKLYFTKLFERDNPMGLVGESSPDYFPLDNVMDFPVPAGVINAKALSNDQLAVYFRNEQVWIVSGGDSVLNPPPPGNIARRPTYQTVGLFAPDAVIPYSDSNIFVGREGVYRFRGIGSRPELLSETQGGILDDIENQYFRNSKLVSYGREIWLLIDSDNDGDLDKILILDLERDFVSRNIVDRAWRGRTYPVAITDMAVHSTGDEFREILAADAVDGWIMKLNDGDTDNGAAIEGTAESHDLRAPHNANIYQLLMQPFYNDDDNLPDYDLTVTSHAGDTFQISMAGGVDITGNEDIRGHTMGLRMKRPVSVRLKVVMTSTKRDVIRGFTFSYDRE